VRVVSVISTELFDEQSSEYKKMILPDYQKNRIAIEAGTDHIWYKYVGTEGKIIGINTFGASAPYEELYQQYGISADEVVSSVSEMIFKE
jgi:transketolase